MADMLERFNFKLLNIMKTKKRNGSFLTKERYNVLLKKVTNSKNKSSGEKTGRLSKTKKIRRNESRQC